MSETFGDVVRSTQAAWAAAFAQRDWAALAALYAPQTAFYGSTPALHTDPAGVLSYFQALPAGYVAARFGPPQLLPLGDDLVAASGSVVFTVERDGQRHDRPYRISQVFQRTAEGWRIALHHASPRPA